MGGAQRLLDLAPDSLAETRPTTRLLSRAGFAASSIGRKWAAAMTDLPLQFVSLKSSAS